MEPASPITDTAPLVIHRRRSIRILTRAMAVLLFIMAPLLLVLPLLMGRSLHDTITGHWGALAVAVLTSLLLAGAGVIVLRASRPDWLRLTLDADGLVVSRGRSRQVRSWSDIARIEATTRRNGRITVPTVQITGSSGAKLYLDDVYDMRPDALVRAMRDRCHTEGHALPPPPPPRSRWRPQRPNWLWAILPFILLLATAFAYVRSHLTP